MTNREYIKKELSKVTDIRALSLKIYGWNEGTKQLNINLDSIKELKNYLNRIERKLIKEQIKQNNSSLKELNKNKEI